MQFLTGLDVSFLFIVMSDIGLPDFSGQDLGIDLDKGIFVRKGKKSDNDSNDSGNNSMNTNGSGMYIQSKNKTLHLWRWVRFKPKTLWLYGVWYAQNTQNINIYLIFYIIGFFKCKFRNCYFIVTTFYYETITKNNYRA